MAYHLHQHHQQQQLELPPGFRYHPTDEEIINFYLIPKVLDRTFVAKAIGEVDLNKSEPWELPGKAKMGEKEWYFYCQKDRKYPTGIRTNRATEAGYWKATGKDKEIVGLEPPVLVGMKKTLVFYKGRAPSGEKTNWVMHEYRIETRKEQVPYAPSSAATTIIHAASKDEWVVCRIFHKSSGIKKVVMPSYDMPMSMGDQQHQNLVDDSGTACTLPPLMNYASSSSSLAPPPPQLHAPSSYQLLATAAGTSMMDSAAVLPTMNGHYFGNHQMMAPPQAMSLYQQQQQQMQMMGTSNNDQSNVDEISSMDMGMDGIWKF